MEEYEDVIQQLVDDKHRDAVKLKEFEDRIAAIEAENAALKAEKGREFQQSQELRRSASLQTATVESLMKRNTTSQKTIQTLTDDLYVPQSHSHTAIRPRLSGTSSSAA